MFEDTWGFVAWEDVAAEKTEGERPAAALAVSHGEQGAAGLPSENPVLATYPDELDSTDVLTEGAARSVIVNAYERNPEARRRCIEHFGPACFVCGFDFARTYGVVMDGYIHVHHLKPLSEIGAQYVVDPVADLRPICPNCHGVVHSRNPPYTLDEVRDLLQTAKG